MKLETSNSIEQKLQAKTFIGFIKELKWRVSPKKICKIMIKSSHFDKNKTIPPPI